MSRRPVLRHSKGAFHQEFETALRAPEHPEALEGLSPNGASYGLEQHLVLFKKK